MRAYDESSSEAMIAIVWSENGAVSHQQEAYCNCLSATCRRILTCRKLIQLYDYCRLRTSLLFSGRNVKRKIAGFDC